MLNVRSGKQETSSTGAPPAASAPAARDPDLTARARIRDAAIDRFGQDGIAATSLRTIAADAGVSAALVMHHFGSKDGLRVACDDHVAVTIREGKRQAMAAGPGADPLVALRQADETRPLLRYLARVLIDPSPAVAELVDELVDDAEAYMAEGVRTGMLRPSADPRGRAVVLTMWSLGALVLHEHVARLLGADLTADTQGLVAYSLPATELLGEGALTPEVYAQIRAAYEDLASPGDHHQEHRA
jgi:AcrR family transcriptional regulator